ncbi:L-histidine N(alpha)-methyltransferase [soil metagenome]
MTMADFKRVEQTRPEQSLEEAVRESLRMSPKSLPTRFLYDHTGSDLFERITCLPEYYLTRLETEILRTRCGEIIEEAGYDISMIEFGSGSSIKTRILIEATMDRQRHLTYTPIDISESFLHETALSLESRYPRLKVSALAAEYFDAIDHLPAHEGPRLILFLGSNIGNLTHTEANDFLSRLRKGMRHYDRLLIGVDQVKEPNIIQAAYNDRAGVTAEFNKNLLRRLNRELDATFVPAAFRHHAPYDPKFERVEMRLYSLMNQVVAIPGIGESVEFQDGEYIHTEWSHKYSPSSFAALLGGTGLAIHDLWMDRRGWYGLYMLRPEKV